MSFSYPGMVRTRNTRAILELDKFEPVNMPAKAPSRLNLSGRAASYCAFVARMRESSCAGLGSMVTGRVWP